MAELKRIGVLSAAKMSGAIEFAECLIFAVLLLAAPAAVAAFLGPGFASLESLGVLVLLAVPVMGALAGFCGNGLAACVYNILAPRIGGVTFEFRGKRVNRLGVLPVAKFAAVFGAVIGIVMGAAASVSISSTMSQSAPAVAVVAAAMVFAILTVAVIVFAVLMALIYNLAAPLIGGVVLDISGGELKGVGPMPYAKMVGIFSAIGGLFDGVIYALMGSNPASSAMIPSFAASMGALSVVAFPLAYFVVGFACALLQGWLYNWLSGRIGGVAVDLE
jgi:hypothetical protein